MIEHAHWFIRIPFAASFIYHGLGKFPVLEKMAGAFDLPVPIMVLVAIAEVLAGVGAIVGGLPAGILGRLPTVKQADIVTRLSGLAAAPVLLGAIFMVHWPRWSFAPSESHPMGGMEFQVVLLGIAVYFMLAGRSKE
jgi:putative oxidoreductase